MDTTNAFDLLVLPILQWFVGIFSAFPILHGLRVGLGRWLGGPTRDASEDLRA
jgi:hypothetical protein